MSRCANEHQSPSWDAKAQAKDAHTADHSRRIRVHGSNVKLQSPDGNAPSVAPACIRPYLQGSGTSDSRASKETKAHASTGGVGSSNASVSAHPPSEACTADGALEVLAQVSVLPCPTSQTDLFVHTSAFVCVCVVAEHVRSHQRTNALANPHACSHLPLCA